MALLKVSIHETRGILRVATPQFHHIIANFKPKLMKVYTKVQNSRY